MQSVPGVPSSVLNILQHWHIEILLATLWEGFTDEETVVQKSND